MKYVYFRIAYPGQNNADQRIVRIEASSLNAEWIQMCSDRNQMYPMEILNRSKLELSEYQNVQLAFLKRMPEAQSATLDDEWAAATSHWERTLEKYK